MTEEKNKVKNKAVKRVKFVWHGGWQCGVCMKVIPVVGNFRTIKDVVPAWAYIKWNNKKYKIPLCEQCTHKLLKGR